MSRSSLVLVSIAAIIVIATSVRSLSQGSDPLPETDNLRVMSFNLHQGFDNAARANPALFLEALRDANPDIVSLQESESNRLLSSQYDQVLWLARRLGMHYHYGPESDDNIYGVSILSRYPLSNKEVIFLPSVEDQRVAVQADFEYEGRSVRFVAVHLGLSVEDRYHQMKYIYDEIIKDAELPVIVAGDFNTIDTEYFVEEPVPTDNGDGMQANRLREYEQRREEGRLSGVTELARESRFQGMRTYRRSLVDSWLAVNPGTDDAFTWMDTHVNLGKPIDEANSSVRIDYVFVSSQFEVISSAIDDSEKAMAASDHLPVISDLRWKDSANEGG